MKEATKAKRGTYKTEKKLKQDRRNGHLLNGECGCSVKVCHLTDLFPLTITLQCQPDSQSAEWLCMDTKAYSPVGPAVRLNVKMTKDFFICCRHKTDRRSLVQYYSNKCLHQNIEAVQWPETQIPKPAGKSCNQAVLYPPATATAHRPWGWIALSVMTARAEI